LLLLSQEGCLKKLLNQDQGVSVNPYFSIL